LQFIPSNLITEAQHRIPRALSDDALIAGCDLSWGGDDAACIRFRRGNDAKTLPPIKIPGKLTKDEAVMVVKLAEVLDKEWDCGPGVRRKVDMLFIDSAGSCGPIVRRLRELGYRNIIEVNFGAHSPDKRYKLVRSFIWSKLKEALPQLAIDASPDLEADLGSPGYRITGQTEILLEPKQDIIKRLGHSTDDGDALALTFYAPVKSEQARRKQIEKRRPSQVASAWS
jgi:hypothetical protein